MCRMVNVPKTKDEQHNVVYPEDFWTNHGFQLRSTFEGRICFELLRIGREDPEKAEEINEHYNFVFETGLPIEYIPDGITIPHIAKIKPVRTVRIEETDYLVGDEFKEETVPIFTHPNGYVSLKPLNMDGSISIFRRYPTDLTPWTSLVPELQESVNWYKTILEDERSIWSRFHDLEGNIISITQDKELSDYLKTKAKHYVLKSLADARCSLESPHFPGNGCHDIAIWPKFKITYASEELQKKLAISAEALCLEYLAEMQD